MLSIGMFNLNRSNDRLGFKFCVVEEGAKSPLARVTRAHSLGNLLFCFHNLHRRGEKGWKKREKRRHARGGDVG